MSELRKVEAAFKRIAPPVVTALTLQYLSRRCSLFLSCSCCLVLSCSFPLAQVLSLAASLSRSPSLLQLSPATFISGEIPANAIPVPTFHRPIGHELDRLIRASSSFSSVSVKALYRLRRVDHVEKSC